MVMKILGVSLLLGAIACAGIAYMIGGPGWGNEFDFNRMMHDGSSYLLATPVCLLFGIGLIFHKKKSPTP